MQKPVQAGRALSLAFITAAFVILSVMVAGALGYLVINERAREYQRQALTAAVETRARGIQLSFARALYREWNSLNTAAEQVSNAAPQDLQAKLNMFVGDGSVVSWAGYAQTDGVVQAASNGMLINVSVGARPWFQRGLEGRYAGDVHEAVLLASLLPGAGGEPRRFLDLATPVKNAGGGTMGVLGLHLNFTWARDYLKELSKALGVDVFLVNSQGQAIVATDGGTYSNLDLPSFRTARAGASGVNVETWPDGHSYFTATLPELSYNDLPRFGWSIIARIDSDALTGPSRGFSTGLLMNILLLGLFLILLTILFIVVFVRPFHHLARNAQKIAAGKEVYPYESKRTWELATIGGALAHLQAQTSANSPQPDACDREA
ncbi:cache domain-containing protein [Neorhizobium petrolearium]|uniref:cache domain-containing protein n=1 Tax=Neorhizobium petrolearium TaxID=515361 RepID=UPI003F15610C